MGSSRMHVNTRSGLKLTGLNQTQKWGCYYRQWKQSKMIESAGDTWDYSVYLVKHQSPLSAACVQRGSDFAFNLWTSGLILVGLTLEMEKVSGALMVHMNQRGTAAGWSKKKVVKKVNPGIWCGWTDNKTVTRVHGVQLTAKPGSHE